MPKAIHDKLVKEASKKFPGKGEASKKRKNAYVFGTLAKLAKQGVS